MTRSAAWTVTIAGTLVAIGVALVLGDPWLRWLDDLVGGDDRGLQLAVVGWCWLLALPTYLAVWATRRYGSGGLIWWLLVIAAGSPLLAYLPSRGSSPDGHSEHLTETLGRPAQAGTITFVAFAAAVLVIGLGWLLHRYTRPSASPGTPLPPAPAEAWLHPAVGWTIAWAAIAALTGA